jgi:hypothetical protein
MTVAKNIVVNIDNKSIEWTDRRYGARYSTVLQTVRLLTMGPEQLKVMPRLAHWTGNSDSYNLHSELQAYLERPRKALGGRSYSSIFLENEASDRARKAKAAEIEARLDQETPFLDAASAALDAVESSIAGFEIKPAFAHEKVKSVPDLQALADQLETAAYKLGAAHGIGLRKDVVRQRQSKLEEARDNLREASHAPDRLKSGSDERLIRAEGIYKLLDDFERTTRLFHEAIKEGKWHDDSFDERLDDAHRARIAIIQLVHQVAA